MALSNKFGMLVLTTGNKSELATGYCTLYGDMCGGLAPIGDVPKMMVYEISRWVNREKAIIPLDSLTKPPSAELRPNQTDQDTLPPYELVDRVLRGYVEEQKDPARGDRLRRGPRRGRARRAADRDERIQAPPGRAGAEDHLQGVRLRPPGPDRETDAEGVNERRFDRESAKSGKNGIWEGRSFRTQRGISQAAQ